MGFRYGCFILLALLWFSGSTPFEGASDTENTVCKDRFDGGWGETDAERGIVGTSSIGFGGLLGAERAASLDVVALSKCVMVQAAWSWLLRHELECRSRCQEIAFYNSKVS